MNHALRLPNKERDLIIPGEDDKKAYGDCRIFLPKKGTNVLNPELYLFKTIKTKDMGAMGHRGVYNSRGVSSDELFNCRDCGVEGWRRGTNARAKVRCDKCHKAYRAAYARAYTKRHIAKYGHPRDKTFK